MAPKGMVMKGNEMKQRKTCFAPTQLQFPPECFAGLPRRNLSLPRDTNSMDWVVRNEAVDRTHLAEFHQIQGLICDYGLTLGDLIGVLEDFFSSQGMSKLRCKPAYSPYTEPSMEFFSYHGGLKKLVTQACSGLKCCFPWDYHRASTSLHGVSLERPTMILYGIDNIRDLFGHKVHFNAIRSSTLPLGFKFN